MRQKVDEYNQKKKQERVQREIAFESRIKQEREQKKAPKTQENEPFNFADELFEEPEAELETPVFEERQPIFRNRHVEYTIENKCRFLNLKSSLEFLKPETLVLIKMWLDEHRGIKVSFTVDATYRVIGRDFVNICTHI